MSAFDVNNTELKSGNSVVCVSNSSRMLPYCTHPTYKPRSRRNPRKPNITDRDNPFTMISKTYSSKTENARAHYDEVPANRDKILIVDIVSNGHISFKNDSSCKPWNRLLHFHPAERFKKV